MQRKEIGRLGENYAAQFLQCKNYQVLNRNYYCRVGEIDLIAIDRSNKQLVFIEVKTRSNHHFGSPEESISYSKKHKLIKSALTFLQRQPSIPSWRIDLIAVELDKQYSLQDLRHLKNILDG